MGIHLLKKSIQYYYLKQFNKMFKKYIIILLLLLSFHIVKSQDRFHDIDIKLDTLSSTIIGLNNEIDFTASGVSIQEFIRAIGVNNNVNISIDSRINNQLINNFSQVKVKDILSFLCKEYSLDITIIGTIISIEKYTPPLIAKTYIPKKLKVSYDALNDYLNIDLKNDSLFLVAKAITDASGKNIILNPEVRNITTSSYIQNMPLESTLREFAYANSLDIKHTEDDFYILSRNKPIAKKTGKKSKYSNKNKNKNNDNSENSSLTVSYANGLISIDAINADINEILKQVSIESNIDYIMLEPIENDLTLAIKNVGFETLLSFLLSGTSHIFTNENSTFLIGKKANNSLKTTKTICLQHRSVVEFITYIPTTLKSELEIIEFKEQNSIIVHGNLSKIIELEAFIRTVDKIVPMVVIDVLIIDNKSNYTISTGVEAGISESAIQSTVKLLPEADITLGAQSINQLINSFNGLGFVNLGKVTPNFYLSIKALEANGVIKVNSTPKLATLNGSEAKLTLGNTTYYYEERNDVITNQSTQNIQTKQYKPLKADFTVTIKPIVSGDEQVTLEITVDQSDFTGEVVDGAPPGQVTRSFTSTVRVKNQEMILLGGLEEKVKSEESRGWPILSRIPVIKWLFSSRKKEKKTSKLNIFVKPTIIY